MFIVGLTGGIATGKSTVSRIFKDLGCPVVDADQIAREVVKPHQPAWNALVQSFGRDILLPNGEIDREKLGKIVFGDDAKRRVLNKCTHPAIYKSIWWNLMKCLMRGERFVILDLPLLYESGAALFLMKEVIVVYCDQATQLKRLMDRNNFTKSDAEQRINAQMSLDEKCRRASYVIDNSSNRESTEKQVKRLIHKEELNCTSRKLTINSKNYKGQSMVNVPKKRLIVFLSFGIWVTQCMAEDGFRIYLRETEGSSQYRRPSYTHSKWRSNPMWTQSFRDDTDNQSESCYYEWRVVAQHIIKSNRRSQLYLLAIYRVAFFNFLFLFVIVIIFY